MICHLRKLDSNFLQNWKEYDRADNFLLIINQTEFYFVRNQKWNRQYNHINFNFAGNKSILLYYFTLLIYFTHRKSALILILVKSTEIWLHLLISNLLAIKLNSLRLKINRKCHNYNRISVDLQRIGSFFLGVPPSFTS